MVFVYFNLHKKTFSIRDEKTKKVINYSDMVVLSDAIFKVSDAGRKRVLKEQRKNVHAGVRGSLIGLNTGDIDLKKGYIEVTYNPYLYSSFVVKATGEKIESADFVVLINKRVFIKEKDSEKP